MNIVCQICTIVNMKVRKKGTISSKISNKIKFERMKRNISQEDLALSSGLTQTGLSKIETGKVSPTIDSLEFIAQALGMEFLELVDVSKVEL